MPGAGRRWFLAPSPEWLVPGSSKGVVSSSPLGGTPYDLRPLPARLSGTKGRGFSATRCPSPILLKSLLPRTTGGGVGSRERSFSPLSVGRSAGVSWVCTAGGSRRGHCFQDAREQRRGAHARRLPPPPGLAGARAPAAGGAHVGCRALARRLDPGRIPSRSHSPGMWGCDCYSTFRRRGSALPLALRLALSRARPRGMPPRRSADVTAMLCTSSPPSPLHFLCGAHLLLGKSACAAGRPDSSQSAPPPCLRPPLPLRCVCTTAEAQRANAGRPGLGVEIKQTMTFPFSARLSQVKTRLKTTSVVSDPAPHPTPSSEFKCPVSRFSL